MKQLTMGLSALALLTGLSGAPLADENVTAWRLFVGDREAPKVSVIDAVAGTVIETFEVQAPAALHATSSGRSVYGVVGSHGVVSVMATGIDIDDHGDHADIDVGDPALLDVTLTGDRPAHFVELQGNIAQWFDGEEEVRLFGETAMLEGAPDTHNVDVAAAHHGVAVPYPNHVVVSIPDPQDASRRPIGARILDLEGNSVGEDAPCPGLHGSAGSGSLYALACDTGLLLISQNGGVPRIDHLPYGADLPEGSATTLIGGKGLQYFIGNYGPDRIVLVDPGEESFHLVQLPTRRVHFAVDPVRARFAYVFTEDGQLHQIDVIDGTVAKSLRVTEPYSMDGNYDDPRPRIAVAGDAVYVTDPLQSVLHVIDPDSFQAIGEIAVEGLPYTIVAVGGTGVVHGDHDHDHDHEEDGHDHDEDGHGHDHPEQTAPDRG